MRSQTQIKEAELMSASNGDVAYGFHQMKARTQRVILELLGEDIRRVAGRKLSYTVLSRARGCGPETIADVQRWLRAGGIVLALEDADEPPAKPDNVGMFWVHSKFFLSLVERGEVETSHTYRGIPLGVDDGLPEDGFHERPAGHSK